MVIGNRKHTLFWYDNWHPYGLLKDKYDNKVIYDADINNHVLKNKVIKVTCQNWPQTNSLDLMEIKKILDCVPLSGEDMVKQLPNKNGVFSIRLA